MDAVVTSLLTSSVDPQRGIKLRPSPALFAELALSLRGHFPLFVINDEMDEPDGDNIYYVRRPAGTQNVYAQRWINTLDFLKSTSAIERVWIVDATDVTLLNQPPDLEEGRVYVGYEPQIVGCDWMMFNHLSHSAFLTANRDKLLMNAGVLGGYRTTVIDFIQCLVDEWFRDDRSMDVGDMATFNAVCYSPRWYQRVTSGPRIVTVFKQYETNNEIATWKHK